MKKYFDQILEILIKNHCQFSFYWCYSILWTKFVFLQTEPSKARSLRKSKLSIVTPTKTELTVILGQISKIWPKYFFHWRKKYFKTFQTLLVVPFSFFSGSKKLKNEVLNSNSSKCENDTPPIDACCSTEPLRRIFVMHFSIWTFKCWH